MDMQHINAKFFLVHPEAVDLEACLGVFQRWIQEQAFDELLIDVADYRHVHAGPGVVLVGHEANYSLDNGGGRLGLLYNRKARLDGPLPERLRQAARAALAAAQRLEREHGLSFDGGEVQLVVNDRLAAPNTDATLQAVAPELTAFLGGLYPGSPHTLERAPDPRERFTLTVRAEGRWTVEALLDNLEAAEPLREGR